MDVNGTRHHLLLGQSDWMSCAEGPGGALGVDSAGNAEPEDGKPSLKWDERRVALTLWRRIFQFTPPTSSTLALSARRGAGRDRFGNWYWIDDDAARVRINSSGSGMTTTFWPPETIDDGSASPGSFHPREPASLRPAQVLRGLVVTRHHRLIVGTLNVPGLLVFDLHTGGPPEHMVWPESVPFSPFDFSPTRDGGAVILDRDARSVWTLDCHLKVVRRAPPVAVTKPEDFTNLDGTTRKPPRRAIPISAEPISAEDPIAVESLDDDTLLILDRAPEPARASSAIRRYRFGVELGTPQFLDSMNDHVDPASPQPLDLLAHDIAVAGGRLLAAASNGVQAFVYDLDIQGDAMKLIPSTEYRPMRFFGGKALVADGERVYYDYSDGWIDLVEQRRERYRGSAVATTPPFDGKEPGCVWHRLLLDAAIPGSARVEVWSRASDEPEALRSDRVAWSREPALVVRPEGSEIPFAPHLSPCPAAPGEGTWELLFQRARGRYLQLRLRLSGDGTTTPVLRALRVYYPRFSYLENYLPAVYRDEPESASFLDRFLALFEGFFTTIEERIAATQLLFDLRTAPPDALAWLASFFGVALDPAWDEPRRRLFLRHATTFFRHRGTIGGLRAALELALTRCPSEAIFDGRVPTQYDSVRVVEKFRTRRTPGVVFGASDDLDGIRALPRVHRWKPIQGRAPLIVAWRAVLRANGLAADDALFPIRRPLDDSAGLWSAFSRSVLGFVPSATAEDQPLWEDLQKRAYGGVQRPLPTALPEDGAALADWYRFETMLAVRGAAHRFVVALPVPPTDTGNASDYQQRRALAERLVALEKPAHTVFEVRFYWAMFCIGEARLGIDTRIHRGSRIPELLGPAVLGQSYLAEGYLTPRPPQDAADRSILGRDLLRE